MSSWIKINNGAISKRVNGAHNLSTSDGWREVAYPASQWKLDALGRVIKKSQADLDANAQPRINALIEDRQRVGAKIDSVLTALEAGDRVPLRKLLTRIVMKSKELESSL